MEEIRIGVYTCWCGTNIALMVDVEDVAKEIAKLPGVVISKDYKYMCSDPGQDLIISDIKEHNLNRIVVASCSPRMHELTFRKALEKAGLNSYYVEMANIREQDSWVHTNRAEATVKAKALVVAAVNRVAHHEALDSRSVEINPATLVIGGGISGISAALEIADAGKKVYIVERQEKIGGYVAQLDLTYPYMYSASQMLAPLMTRLENHENIEIFNNSTIKDVSGYIGNFKSTVQTGSDKETEIVFGNIIVATGLKPFDPAVIEEYGYGKYPDVITSLEFEKMLALGKVVKKDGSIPKNVAIIHCVGSRNKKHHEYCSRTCCMSALKYSNQIKSEIPDSNVFEIYADMRTFAKGCEELYAYTSKRNVKFLMYDQENTVPKVVKAEAKDKCEMFVEVDEKLSGKSILVPADMVVLMVAMESHENVKEVAHAVGVSICGSEFFIEKHPKLDPVATTTSGVYIVGSCQAPKDIPDSVAQAKAAAARILATIAKGVVDVEVTTASVNEDMCCGCQTCIMVCPYTAISFDADKKVSVVNEVLCKGCGTCGATCPTGAIKCKHFTDLQIMSEIEGLFKTIVIQD